MILICYRTNGSSGGCHCHGPDERWDSTFETYEAATLDEAHRFAANFIMGKDPDGHGEDSDFTFTLIQPKPEIPTVESEDNAYGGLVKTDLSSPISTLVKTLRDERQALLREKARIKKAADDEREATRIKEAERKEFERLRAKFA